MAVTKRGAVVARQAVPNYGTALADLSARPGFALGWARFPDGAEELFLYDAHDDGFGYAVNLTDPACSEWGYAPFGHAD